MTTGGPVESLVTPASYSNNADRSRWSSDCNLFGTLSCFLSRKMDPSVSDDAVRGVDTHAAPVAHALHDLADVIEDDFGSLRDFALALAGLIVSVVVIIVVVAVAFLAYFVVQSARTAGF